MHNVVVMTDEQFGQHMAAKKLVLDMIEKGIADLRSDLAQMIERLDELLAPQRDAEQARQYRADGSPNG